MGKMNTKIKVPRITRMNTDGMQLCELGFVGLKDQLPIVTPNSQLPRYFLSPNACSLRYWSTRFFTLARMSYQKRL